MRAISPEIRRQVKAIELRTRGLVGALFAGEYRSVFRGQGMEFAEVRPWVDGDDMRAVDWNVTARLGAPYVKTFTAERELTVFLVVDRSGSVWVGEPVAKAAREAEVAAVLALAAAWHGDRVGALAFADTPGFVVPPAKGRRHALRIARELLEAEPGQGGTDLASALAYTGRLLRHRGIVVVLSDFVAEGWERALRQLAVRHDVVAVTVDDPREIALPDAGWITLVDAERGERVLLDSGDAGLRARVDELALVQRRARARVFRQAGVAHLALRTDEDYARALRRLFGAGRRR